MYTHMVTCFYICIHMHTFVPCCSTAPGFHCGCFWWCHRHFSGWVGIWQCHIMPLEITKMPIFGSSQVWDIGLELFRHVLLGPSMSLSMGLWRLFLAWGLVRHELQSAVENIHNDIHSYISNNNNIYIYIYSMILKIMQYNILLISHNAI